MWLGGLALALFIATAGVGNFFLPADRAVSLRSVGFDFLAFYTGGTLVRTGQTDKLYDLKTVRATEQHIARENDIELRPGTVGPFWNPPIVAWLFVPLSALPYRTAFFVWTFINLACLSGAMILLCRMLGDRDWRTWGLVPLLTLTSMPLIMALGHGQNTCMSLLLLCSAVSLWRGERLFAAGAVAGLLFYKPQVGMIISGVMIFCGGWRVLAGLAITGTAMLLATLLTLPGALMQFIAKTPVNLAYMQVERPYAWGRHVTLKAFWRLLVQGQAPGPLSGVAMTLYLATALLSAAAVVACIWKLRRSADTIARDQVISLSVLATPLLMPFYFDYDLLLLAVPAVLTARHAISIGASRSVTITWIALYAWMMVNPHVAAVTRVNATVLALAAVTTATMLQASRRGAVQQMENTELTPLRRAA